MHVLTKLIGCEAEESREEGWASPEATLLRVRGPFASYATGLFTATLSVHDRTTPALHFALHQLGLRNSPTMDPAWDEGALETGKPRATRKKKSRMVRNTLASAAWARGLLQRCRPLTASALFACRAVSPPQSPLRSCPAGEGWAGGAPVWAQQATPLERALSLSSSAAALGRPSSL